MNCENRVCVCVCVHACVCVCVCGWLITMSLESFWDFYLECKSLSKVSIAKY